MPTDNNTTTIMIVDDTIANLKLLGAMLRNQGYRVVQFPRGAPALRAASKTPPDLILLDIMMPEMSGFEVCQALQSDPELRAIPVIFISAINDIEHKIRAFYEGGVDYVTKPFQEEEVIARVRTHLKLRHTQRALEQEQRALEALVQERTADLLRAQRVARIGSWTFDLIKDQLTWSAQTYLMFDIPRYQPVDFNTFLSCVYSEDRNAVVQAWNNAMNGAAYDIEHRILVGNKVLWVREKAEFEFNQQGVPIRALGTVQDITEQKNHQAQLDYAAHHDTLTGLPNRTAFTKHLRQAMATCKETQEQLAVAYIDLDNLIALNDTYGRAVGDELIIALGQRLRDSAYQRHDVARIGGDEFAVLLTGLGRSETVPVQRLIEKLSRPVLVGNQNLIITASIGVTRFPQPRDVDADQLLRQADQAMYQAKLAGKNRYHVFDPAKDASTRERYERIEEIRHALSQDQFILYYQPKVHLSSGALLGFEALIRWQHPERGLLPPGVFIPLIEQHPLSIALGDWVISAALRQLQEWQTAHLDTTISVNIGTLQLHDLEFADRLEQQLKAHPELNPGQLELEILETGAIKNMERASSMVNRLREMGVVCALDDFGTGYSSLTFLKQLPTHAVKIDQSFVRQMLTDAEHLVIIHSILGLASSFDRQVVAEGVETEDHGRLLLELGCEFGQGYGIAQPMPPAAVFHWLDHWQPPASWQEITPLTLQEVPSLIAEIEHHNWYEQLMGYLQGEEPVVPHLDSRLCRFGRWLEDPDTRRRFIRSSGLMQLKAQHKALHNLADNLIARYQADAQTDISALLMDLNQGHEKLLNELRHLRQANFSTTP